MVIEKAFLNPNEDGEHHFYIIYLWQFCDFFTRTTNPYRQLSTIRASNSNLPRKSYFLMTITITKDDVMEFIKHRPEYKKVNAFKDMKVDIYI